ncbi:hypothetical protein FH608_026365 [Nonomuraea phyllanthi]|uniref:Uncharacterized protein n=1 Tax=Nonomuraea phyllanthi TaxID=2219224 RepID=A0A5C4W727_9ACTN|nr:hypothetical protein [Nonomuraea phyllanthi]KAB8192220.1 hypothetical protein FH608_026365 [Nonomuraea phyllanthi]QFY11427.1 hypothetical protein GBF35_36930 [Nonomuraea phyllanthi]
MLLTEMAPPPGAQELAGLRARARTARRRAFVALSASLALLTSAQLLADRAQSREQALPLAVLSLAVFVVALPALAITQYAWGARARLVRERERELYAVVHSGRARPFTRLAVAGCWAVTLLLGWTAPRFFRQAALDSFADVLSWIAEALAVVSVAVGVSFALWWARDAVGMLARRLRSGGSPGDPWDPGPAARPREGAALWAGAAVAVAALVGARAHLWEPATGIVYALLTAALVCGVVTDE